MVATAVVVAAINFGVNVFKGLKASKNAKKMARQYFELAARYRLNASMARLNGSRNEDVSRAKQRSVLSEAAAAAGEAGMGTSATTASSLETTYNAMEENILFDRYAVESEAENYLYQAAMAEHNARKMKKRSKHKYARAILNAGLMVDFSSFSNGK